MLVWANQGNYFKNATACSKHTLKTTVATQLQQPILMFISNILVFCPHFCDVSVFDVTYFLWIYVLTFLYWCYLSLYYQLLICKMPYSKLRMKKLFGIIISFLEVAKSWEEKSYKYIWNNFIVIYKEVEK